jgi:predicted RNase H-like HicB family nuclease
VRGDTFNIAMELTLTAVFEEMPERDGGGFCACAEEIPGANTQGATNEEAPENLKYTICEVLAARRDILDEELAPHKYKLM